ETGAAKGFRRGCFLLANRKFIQRRTKAFFTDDVLREAKSHTHTGACESEMPIHFLCKVSRDDRPEKCAEIDSHIENRKSGVAARIAIFIKRTDHRAHIRFEKTGADHDQQKTCI